MTSSASPPRPEQPAAAAQQPRHAAQGARRARLHGLERGLHLGAALIPLLRLLGEAALDDRGERRAAPPAAAAAAASLRIAELSSNAVWPWNGRWPAAIS